MVKIIPPKQFDDIQTNPSRKKTTKSVIFPKNNHYNKKKINKIKYYEKFKSSKN